MAQFFYCIEKIKSFVAYGRREDNKDSKLSIEIIALNPAYLAFAALGLIWGTNFMFMKWASVDISASQIVFLRTLFGFLPILAMALFRGELKWRHLRHAHHWLILHGRYTCLARRPLCEKCIINDLCLWPGKTIA